MEDLLEQEKHFRLNGEREGSARTLKAIVDSSIELGEKKLVETVGLMGRKKGQIKEAFREAVLHAYNLVLDKEKIKISPFSYRDAKEIDLLIGYKHIGAEKKNDQENEKPAETNKVIVFLKSLLSSVVEGRIYLEEERILITDTIKQIYEKKGEIRNALESIYNVNIETFSSLSVEEIILYQMEQMRLAILCCDKEKVSALSKRISSRHLSEVPYLKKVYMNRMIFVNLGEKKYNNVSNIFVDILSAEEVSGTSTSIAAKYAIFYGILALFMEEKSTKDLVKRSVHSKLCDESARMLGEIFLQKRLIFPDTLEDLLHKSKIDDIILSFHAQEMHRVLLQHNLTVISMFYSRITIERMAEVFRMPKEDVYVLVTEMIREGAITGTVDQRTETVVFLQNKDALSEWASSIDKCLELIIKITHSIKKTE